MACIVIVECYPYAAVLGGDGVYIDRLRGYLASSGNDVISIVTDVSRGRANPIFKLQSQLGSSYRWILRAGVHIGKSVYLSLLPRLAGNAARRLLGLPLYDGGVSEAEKRWLVTQVSRLDPDFVILAFGACAFAETLAGGRARIIALRGFLAEIEHGIAAAGHANAQLLADRDAELASADLVTFNNKRDVQSYIDRTGRAASMVGMGFVARRASNGERQPVVLFVGADTACNLASLRWFIESCWSRILHSVPDAVFRIIGSVGKAYQGALPKGVVAVGMVDDLAPEYHSAAVVVAPLVSGSNGVKTKVAEALSYGRALVTTRLGIEDEDRPLSAGALLIADEADAFAGAVITLLSDPQKRASVESRARILFNSLYSETAAYAHLNLFFNQMNAPYSGPGNSRKHRQRTIRQFRSRAA
jgi:glycosyltransferase involved in cell wall biosynthesis